MDVRDVSDEASLSVEPDVATVRRRKRAATQRLLGDTIAIAESDWREPVALAGWTRAHVATHVARNADAVRRVVEHVTGSAGPAASEPPLEQRRALEAGSRRSALDLQIDLDTSAGRLAMAFDGLDDRAWRRAVPGDDIVVADLPMARLNEVVIHHVDLDCGFGFGDLDDATTRWLLDWNARRAGRRLDLALELVTDTGRTLRVGPPGRDPVRVHGSEPGLLGWLTGRLGPQAVEGADGISLGPPG